MSRSSTRSTTKGLIWGLALQAVLSLPAYPQATPRPLPSTDPARSRSAQENVAFGRIHDVQEMRLDVRDEVSGEVSRLLLSPETIVEIDGRVQRVRDLRPDARIRIERDPSDATQIRRVVVVPVAPSPAEEPEPSSTGAAKVEVNPVPPVPIGWELSTGDNVVVVTRIVAGSPAAAAKLLTGDQLQKVGEKTVLTPEGVDEALHEFPPLAQVPLELVRDDAKFTTVLTLPENHRPRPSPPGELFSATGRRPNESSQAPAEGTSVQVPSLALGWGLLASQNAVQVVRVDPNTPAAAAALQPGDFITHVSQFHNLCRIVYRQAK
jgi:hypothetical protein